jgi:hypothetical protein
MRAQQFAQMLRATADCHEASWVDGQCRYLKSWDEAAEECCPTQWRWIVVTLLFTGDADIWDWCDEVDP